MLKICLAASYLIFALLSLFSLLPLALGCSTESRVTTLFSSPRSAYQVPARKRGNGMVFVRLNRRLCLCLFWSKGSLIFWLIDWRFPCAGEPDAQNGKWGFGAAMAEADAGSELLLALPGPQRPPEERVQHVLLGLYAECSLFLLLNQTRRSSYCSGHFLIPSVDFMILFLDPCYWHKYKVNSSRAVEVSCPW